MPEKEKEKEKKVDDFSTSSKPVATWKSPDMVQQDRSAGWYLIALIIAVAVSFYMYWQTLWTGLALTVVATLILLISSRIKPRDVSCAVYPEGVVVDDKVFRFEEFKSFWLNQGEMPKIKLQRVGRLAGQVEMPMQGADIDAVRLFLVKHIPEEEDKGEDLVETINRIIKF